MNILNPAFRSMYGRFLADTIKEGGDVGKQYKPRGDERRCFERLWCGHCARGEILQLCEVFMAGCHDVASEWRYGPDGQPECSAFQDAGRRADDERRD